MNEDIRNLLIRSFDEKLSGEEQKKLDSALALSRQLQEEKKQLEELRQILSQSGQRKFKPFFPARVLRRISAQERKQEDFIGALNWAFRLFAMIGAVAIILFFALNSKLANDISLDSILGLPTLSIEDTWQVANLNEEDI